MKYKREEVIIGANINGWIITSNIYREDKDGKYNYFVNAICKECKENRKVRVSDIQNGKSTRCIYCNNKIRKCFNYYQTFGEYTILVIKEKKNGKEYKFIFDTKFKKEIKKHYWSYIKTNENIYAKGSDSFSCKNNNIQRLHRFICGLEYGDNSIENKVIDHINRNTFDNRLKNLNVVTFLENAQNSKLRKDNTSGIKGVNWNKRTNKWVARIQFNKKRICKSFDTFEKAVEWRKEQEKIYHQYIQEINNKNNK